MTIADMQKRVRAFAQARDQRSDDVRVAVVIPCYRVRDHALNVIASIGPEVCSIYAVDDACPDGSGAFIEKNCNDARLSVLYNDENQGVGGAVLAGYRKAIDDGADVIVKIDGDGQMDPSIIGSFVAPIAAGHADYAKGNRFFSSASLRDMPFVRLLGNAGLSFFTKASTGYWSVLDPTNGYTAIHASVADAIDFDRVSKRYFFESDMLFHLGVLRGNVVDIPIVSLYGEEQSNLSVLKSLPIFFSRNMANLFKRLVFSYFVRGFSIASLALVFGILMFIGGFAFGAGEWLSRLGSGEATPTGTIVIVSLLMMFGFQLLLLFAAFDISSTPRMAVHPLLKAMPRRPLEQRYPARGADDRPTPDKNEQTPATFARGLR